MSLLMLNILLMTVGPFLVVLPLAAAAWLQSSSAVRPVRLRMPALRLPSIRIEVAWS